jgi:hypothetical protein
VDVVVENVGGSTLVEAWTTLAPGGVLQSIGWTSGEPAVLPVYGTVGPAKSLVSFQAGIGFGADLEYHHDAGGKAALRTPIRFCADGVDAGVARSVSSYVSGRSKRFWSHLVDPLRSGGAMIDLRYQMIMALSAADFGNPVCEQAAAICAEIAEQYCAQLHITRTAPVIASEDVMTTEPARVKGRDSAAVRRS